ncbi:alpha-ketoglutarate-dependent dioxygenase AlkB family protein [Primorskyibacter sp. S187A]|uniref:alpha-ketoglutarate-dependent dioxygenase AlkB family protein n=1 Tax=Primorskyibacter sp. S187A TaxID=3415130 RepID=UPI003C7C7625
MEIDLRGVRIIKGALGLAAQEALLEDVRAIARAAPMVQPTTPGGRKMSVRMTAAGAFGWVSDASGYRYAERHPEGHAWPPIPPALLALWNAYCPSARAPECCLINFYGEGARMGLHQDCDEADFTQPVLSVSLGDDGMFRVGSVTKGGKTASHWMQSGDIAVLGGEARLVHHGVDRIRFGSSRLLPKGGRINVTMRVVT